MPEEVVIATEPVIAEPVSTPAEAPVLTPEQIEFNANMNRAFSDDVVIPAAAEPAPETPIIPETPAVPITEPTPVTPVTDYFGFATIEEAKAEFETLKALKESVAKPVDTDPVKLKEIYQALDRQEKLGQLLEGEVTKENAPAIIKAALVEKYKGLSPEMVNHKFNKSFAIPKEPIELATETEDEFNERHNEWKEQVANVEMEMLIEANLVRPDIEKIKSEIKIPNIQAQAVVDADFEDYKASNARAIEAKETIITPAINAIKETDLQLNFKVEDANNQMEFDITIVPTAEQVAKAKQDSLDVLDYLTKNCYDEKGNFLPAKAVSLFLKNNNFDTYAQTVARQAVNKERERVIAKETVNPNSGRDFNVNTERSEFQKEMDRAFA